MGRVEQQWGQSKCTCWSGVLSALWRCASILCQGIFENFLLAPFQRSLCWSCSKRQTWRMLPELKMMPLLSLGRPPAIYAGRNKLWYWADGCEMSDRRLCMLRSQG